MADYELQTGDVHPLLDPTGNDQSFTSYFIRPIVEKGVEASIFSEAESDGYDRDSEEDPPAQFVEEEWEYREELFAVSTATVGFAAWLRRQRAVNGTSGEMQFRTGVIFLSRCGTRFFWWSR